MSGLSCIESRNYTHLHYISQACLLILTKYLNYVLSKTSDVLQCMCVPRIICVEMKGTESLYV